MLRGLRGRSARDRSGDRAANAILLAVVWLFGMEIAPAVHLAQHDRLGEHSHGAEVHAHSGAELQQDEGGTPPRDHGAGTLQHRAIAALTPAAAVPPIALAPIAELIELDAPRSIPGSLGIAAPQARGPPAA